MDVEAPVGTVEMATETVLVSKVTEPLRAKISPIQASTGGQGDACQCQNVTFESRISTQRGGTSNSPEDVAVLAAANDVDY